MDTLCLPLMDGTHLILYMVLNKAIVNNGYQIKIPISEYLKLPILLRMLVTRDL